MSRRVNESGPTIRRWKCVRFVEPAQSALLASCSPLSSRSTLTLIDVLLLLSGAGWANRSPIDVIVAQMCRVLRKTHDARFDATYGCTSGGGAPMKGKRVTFFEAITAAMGGKDDTVTRPAFLSSPRSSHRSPSVSGNDHATHASHGHRPDAEEGARVEVHVQSCDGEGENSRVCSRQFIIDS